VWCRLLVVSIVVALLRVVAERAERGRNREEGGILMRKSGID
jgi:hypothetical protein